MAECVALIGAGGKMGGRIADNLKKEDYKVLYCEKAEAGIARLREKGLEVIPAEQAIPQADLIILAVPDALMGKISGELVPLARPGATIILLDPAAAAANELTVRDDLNYVVCHPCHPQLFSEQPSDEARKDFFGGIAAIQDVVVALMQGAEEAYQSGERLIRKIFAPVENTHRITVDQMAVLEPAMAEVVGAAAATLLREAMDEAVKAGVPKEAARAFMLGHASSCVAITFDAVAAQFSDACKIAIRYGYENVFKPDWRTVFEPERVREVIHRMLRPEDK